MAVKDRIGERYGHIVVISDTGKRKNGCVVWLCECDCGNEFEKSAGSLIVGRTKVCSQQCPLHGRKVRGDLYHSRVYRVWNRRPKRW